ncbi:MAG: hypothetical protein ACQR33_06360 [Candidatus Saccharibacteria bacterium]
MNRNGQSQQPGRVAAPGAPMQQQAHVPAPVQQQHSQGQGQGHDGNGNFGRKNFNWNRVPGWLRIANVVLLFSITILALSMVLLFRNSNPNENRFVLSDKYQAVFLNNGQVYFGKVTGLNSRYFNLQNVFYLNSQNQSGSSTSTTSNASSNNFTLVKLGCELHGPYDQMIINRDQVTFWENLKDSGQVVKTINEWIKQNPSGQTCSTSTGSSSQSSNAASTTQTGASDTSGTATGTGTGTSTTSTTKKP